MVYKKCIPDLRAYYSALIASACTRVFGGAPWNEHKACGSCGRKYGIHDSLPAACETCGGALGDFWKPGALVEKVNAAFDHPNLSMWVCQDEKTEDVVGFSWGFIEPPANVWEIIDGKAKEYLAGLPGDANVAYQAAVGVLSAYRENGIAKSLYKNRNRDLADMGADAFVVRTNTDSPMYPWLAKMGYRKIDDYGPGDKRVILAASKDDLKFE